MQNNIDQIIKKLNVVSELTPGKTISTSNSEEWSILDHKSWSSSLWRTYSGEGRESSIYEISKLFKYTISILSENNTLLLLEHLEKALKGFDTLKETYKNDYNTIASITLISNKTKDSYNWFFEEYKVSNSRNIENWNFPDSNTSSESSVSIPEDITLNNKVDAWGCYWGESSEEKGDIIENRVIPAGFNTIKVPFNSIGPLGNPGTLGPLGPKSNSINKLPNKVETEDSNMDQITNIGPKESLGNDIYTIEPSGKKNSLVYQQPSMFDEFIKTLVKDTDRSVSNEENNKDTIVSSKEYSDRDSNESIMLEDKPYYETKKKVPYEHISGYKMPNISFHTWLHKE